MALYDVTVFFDLHQLLGADFDPRRTKAYVTTNVENGTLIDTTTGEIRMGDQAVTINAGGTGQFTTWSTLTADGNPVTWQTTLVVDYLRTGHRDRARREFGPYTISHTVRGVTNKALTSNVATVVLDTPHGLRVGDTILIADVDATFNGNYTITAVPSTTSVSYAKTATNVTSTAATGSLISEFVSLALLEDEQAVPPAYLTTVTELLDGFVDEAHGYADDAETARDEAIAITGITTTDAAVEALVKNTGGAGPLTSAALSATIAAAVPDASTTVKGRVELATSAETTTGTDAVRAITPAGLAARVTPRGEDAVSLGVPTDGISDCSTALNAIPANTGRVFLRGRFVLANDLDLKEGVELEGGGWHCSGQPTFGSGAFESYITGSRLVFTNAADAGLLMPALKAAKISDLAIVGPGSGTERGVQAGETQGLARARFDNVLIGNFYEGLYGSGMMNSALYGLYAVGCDTGVKLRNASNGNAFTGLNVEACTRALDFADVTENTFTGGVIQGSAGSAGTVALLGANAHGNIFTGMYMENNGAAWTFDLAATADYNQFIGLHWTHGAAGQSKVRIASNHNWVLGPESQCEITVTGGSNFFLGCFTGGIIDTNGSNVIIDTQANLVKYGLRDLRIGSGKKYFFETTGSNSYIGRNSSTGDTEIGTATGILARNDGSPTLVTKYVAKSAAYTITDFDFTVNTDASGAARTITLPTAVGRGGRMFVVRKSDASANAVTVATTSSQTINGAATYSLTAQYQTVQVESDGANWMVL